MKTEMKMNPPTPLRSFYDLCYKATMTRSLPMAQGYLREAGEIKQILVSEAKARCEFHSVSSIHSTFDYAARYVAIMGQPDFVEQFRVLPLNLDAWGGSAWMAHGQRGIRGSLARRWDTRQDAREWNLPFVWPSGEMRKLHLDGGLGRRPRSGDGRDDLRDGAVSVRFGLANIHEKDALADPLKLLRGQLDHGLERTSAGLSQDDIAHSHADNPSIITIGYAENVKLGVRADRSYGRTQVVEQSHTLCDISIHPR